MNDRSDVTQWVAQLRQGESMAAEKLWNKYFGEMAEVARRKLAGAPRAIADEEDVALSAFKSFCRAAKGDGVPELLDRNELWAWLVAITANKSVDLIRWQNRKKRGGSGTRDVTVDRDVVNLSDLVAQQPAPEFASMMVDELDAFLARIKSVDDSSLETIVLRKLSGESNDTIAARIGCARRTVERKLVLLQRLLLQTEADD